MNNECIFDPYFKNKIVLCDKEYKCQSCEIQSEIREIVQSIALEIKLKPATPEKIGKGERT